jgi:phosphatidylglycerol:prolipoprotein diacylglycerol transferase
VVFPPDSFAGLEFGSQPVHPAQLYFSAGGLLIFAVLWGIRRRVTTPGVLFWTFIVLFTLMRSLLDFTRAYEPTAVITKMAGADITESQLISLAMALFGVMMILRRRRAAAAVLPPAPPPPAPPTPAPAP